MIRNFGSVTGITNQPTGLEVGLGGGSVLKSRQVITNTLWLNDTVNTIKDVTIPIPVDITRSIVKILAPDTGLKTSTYTYTTVELINSTTVRCERYSRSTTASSNPPSAYIIIVEEYDNVKTRQSGSSAGAANITISNVDKNKCLLSTSMRLDAIFGSGSEFNTEVYYVETNTNIKAIRSLTNFYYKWQLIEFN